MYGETRLSPVWQPPPPGLSPHVRGNRRPGACLCRGGGSIPACTGKPPYPRHLRSRLRVYPRMYGETVVSASQRLAAGGLSPHVRGNHSARNADPGGRGSIPACTGKPLDKVYRQEGERVYPRMYGETRGAGAQTGSGAGLSPHVRGNRGVALQAEAGEGSIPACTGKPPRTSTRSTCRGVYPRMYGETLSRLGRLLEQIGLSPHVRGNRVHDLGLQAGGGSIPACTGKPPGAPYAAVMQRVYPRMYGETLEEEEQREIDEGLSPHVRGNQPAVGPRAGGAGSIPACTGKPKNVNPPLGYAEVYPRMYGETGLDVQAAVADPGLSPHVRGNLGTVQAGPLDRGSIPACTGKPHAVVMQLYQVGRSIPACTGKPGSRRARWARRRVYPRMYGETGVGRLLQARASGLSPHVRGNLCQNDPFVIIMSKTDEPTTVTRSPYGESDATPAARPATLDAWEPEWRWTRPRMRS